MKIEELLAIKSTPESTMTKANLLILSLILGNPASASQTQVLGGVISRTEEKI